MKIRRPTTDNEIAVYGNGVFIVIYRDVLRLCITTNNVVRPNLPPYTVCWIMVLVFHGEHKPCRVYMWQLIEQSSRQLYQ
jgi:hypothetical protein